MGRGFFGEVKRALWRGSLVAAKFLYRESFRQKSELELFAREIAVLSKLRHPKVILFLGAVLEGEKKIIVMEYMERGSLHDVLRDRRSLHPRYPPPKPEPEPLRPTFTLTLALALAP